MSLILLLKLFEVEKGLYKILNFETLRFQIEVFKTEIAVDSGGQCSTHCLCFKINTRYKIINHVLNSRYILSRATSRTGSRAIFRIGSRVGFECLISYSQPEVNFHL